MTSAPSSWSNLIAGEWVEATDGRTMSVVAPADGEVIATVPWSTDHDVDNAVLAAQRSLPDWLETTPQERSEMLLKLAEAIERHSDELIRLESRNVGKPIAAARAEASIWVDNIRFFAGAARCLEGRAANEYMRGYTSILRREPIGVVAGICPWNYPLIMAIWKTAPALAAGNTCILKPSELTPLTALRTADLARDLRRVPT